jgi:hypothetical protein
VRPRVAGAGRAFNVVVSDDGAVRLAQLYVLSGPPMLEGEGFIDPKLVEAVELGSKVSVGLGLGRLRRATWWRRFASPPPEAACGESVTCI